MRLSDDTKTIIKKLALKHFGDGCKVILFGSRTDDSLRGGDIDLLIETDKRGSLFDERGRFLVDLKRLIGDQRIDLVIKNEDSSNQEVIQEAYKTGVVL